MWQDKISHLTNWNKSGGGEENWRENRKRKEREKREKKKEEREAPPSLWFWRRSDRRLSSEREAKFAHVTRASHRDQNLGILP